jgi:hypothetical protein
MSCCGGGLSGVQGRALVDGSGTGAWVMLVYTGADRRNLPYVAEGKVYFFGNNERRRVNAVPVRVLSQFLEPAGRYYGSFERWVAVEGPQAAAEDVEPAAASGEVTAAGPAEASEPLAPTEGPGAAQAEPPAASAKKKGAGNVRP